MNKELFKYKPLLEAYLHEVPTELSSYSFVNVLAWKDFFTFDFQVIDENLCIFAAQDMGTFLYLFPLGKNVSPSTIETCFSRMRERNRGRGVSRIENVDQRFLPLLPEQKFSVYLKGYEYCYFRKDLAALLGNAYKSKRNAYNHFIKQHTFSCEAYSPEMLSSCVDLYARWVEQRKAVCRDPVAVQMLEENRSVHRLVMEYFQELGMLGRVAFVDGKLQGYSFGYALNEHTFCVLLEVTDLSIKGLSVYLFKTFCSDPQLAKFKFINVMDDFALDNIKATKLSFRPSLMFPSYTVSLRS